MIALREESTVALDARYRALVKAVAALTSRRELHDVLLSLREHLYRPEDLEFMSRVADLVAVTVENDMSRETVREQQRERLAERDQVDLLLDEIRTERCFDDIVGRSAVLRQLLREVEQVAPTDSTVLITGETGSGKELVARAIHQRSARRGAAFVTLNCAAIPTGLLESELFGHDKGAFTGAIAQRVGRFELAHRGTVFLDEIGEIPLELQPKLLRVLQEREFERLGSARTLKTDARLVAATNRDLAVMATDGSFRQDLFYRLNVFPVRVPPLRERRDDIPMLVRHFARQFSQRMKKPIETIPAETMASLTEYEWPGNIRELQNLVERAVILSTGPVLRVPLSGTPPRAQKSLPLRTGSVASERGRRGLATPPTETLEEVDRRHILAALESSGWVVSGANGAAARLGMKRSTLQFRMARLGIVRPSHQGEPGGQRTASSADWHQYQLAGERTSAAAFSTSSHTEVAPRTT